MHDWASSRATECQFLVFRCCTEKTCVEVMAMTCESLGVFFLSSVRHGKSLDHSGTMFHWGNAFRCKDPR